MKIPISDLIIHPQVRPQQQRTYDLIQQNWPHYHSFFCSLPTGSGKTDLAASLLANYLHNNSTSKVDVLVPYRIHQDFWYNILLEYGRKHGFSVALLKGRSAYYCPIVKTGANIAPCAFDPHFAQICRSRKNCRLLRARHRIRKSQVRILNWWVFKYIDLGEDKANFRIFDEAHNLLNLENLMRVEIFHNYLQSFPEIDQLSNQFIEWEETELGNKQYIELPVQEGLSFINNLHRGLSEREANIATLLNENPQQIKLEILRELKRITEMVSALSDLIENPSSSDLTFFFQRDRQKRQTKLTLQPFDIAFIFAKLFRGSKNLFQSATIGDGEYLAQLLGLKTQHCFYIHETSSFEKENHPFILLKESVKLSTATQQKKHDSFKMIKTQSDLFLDLMKQGHLRGLILTSSFELANLMDNLVKNKGLSVITHTAGKSDDAVKAFISKRKGDVLITPSAWEGISLDDDLARLCLIPKLPFPMLKDPIIQKKVNKYPRFLENDVLISIQQAHGRIQRNAEDWGVTICFDGNFRWLRNKRAKSLEPWFANRIRELTISEAMRIIKHLVKTQTQKKQTTQEERSLQSFSRMREKDREWLESSGLADLLKK
ncbi:MAG: helicase C-terminal domain-containing protein [Candidatus Hodarchaeales archaeon]